MHWLILITFLSVALFSVQALVDWLNARHARGAPVPVEFSGMVSEEQATRAVRYLESQNRFVTVKGAAWLLLSLAFLWAGGFGWIDGVVQGATASPLWAGLFFFGVVGILSEAFSLPFSLYHTFVLEERFGFNRSSFGTFVADRLKGYALAILIGGPALAAMLWFFQATGEMAWLLAWGFLALFQLTVAFLAPVVLMPLFNKFTPLPDGELKSAIERYAESVSFRLQGIFTMDGSKRSAKANAYFTGFGRFRRIVLFDTLVEKHSVNELVAVLAHEVGHFKKGHILKGMALSLVSSFALFYFLSLVLESRDISAAFGFGEPTVYGGLVAAAWLYGPFSLVLGAGASWLSRRFEFEADAFARATTGRGEDLCAALRRLSLENLSNLNPHPWKVFLDYSHPPVAMRIRRLARTE